MQHIFAAELVYCVRKNYILEKTIQQFDAALANCRSVFMQKNKDYGTSWRILRPSSLTDQLYIKAKRIRSIEEKGAQKVSDGVEVEYIGLVNYCLLALIQLGLPVEAPLELPAGSVETLYDQYAENARQLMLQKNHDYGEVWREMRLSSLTDIILSKLLRIKQIEDNDGATLISEGVASNYLDIINYAIFALIKLDESRIISENHLQ